MTNNRVFCVIRAALLTLAVSITATAVAMPTQEELDRIKPLVQDLMKPDLDAMKQGKKSRADVAKSAMELYVKADSPAAKILLARCAVSYYAKAGEYEAAEKSLDALLSAVPDYPAPDLAELLEKTLHPIPLRAAPNLRARLAEIKDKAQAAAQLKKLLSVFDTLAEGPKRKACAARIASAYVVLDDWPNANKYFAVSDSPAATAAAIELKLQAEPEASRSYDKAADAWWSVELPKKDAKLASAIRSHAAALYAKAIPSLKGLAKVQAERRVQEVEESAAEAASAKSESSSSASMPSVGSAKFTGVKLVGSTVKNKDGILIDFSNTSYGLIDHEFSPGNMPIEVVVEFKLPNVSGNNSCVMSSIGNGVSFMPVFIRNGDVVAYLSSDGRTWDIAKSSPIGCSLRLKETCRLKCTWDGKEYSWFVWRGNWSLLMKLPNKKPVASGQKLQFGTDRGLGSAFSGTIDLSKCYIKISGKLWWEGVKGAFKNANR